VLERAGRIEHDLGGAVARLIAPITIDFRADHNAGVDAVDGTVAVIVESIRGNLSATDRRVAVVAVDARRKPVAVAIEVRVRVWGRLAVSTTPDRSADDETERREVTRTREVHWVESVATCEAASSRSVTAACGSPRQLQCASSFATSITRCDHNRKPAARRPRRAV